MEDVSARKMPLGFRLGISAAFIAVLCLVFFNLSSLSGPVYHIALAITAAFLTYGFNETTKYATASGESPGWSFGLKGSAATWAAIYFLLWLFVPRDATQNVRVYLVQQGIPLDEDFTVTARIPRMELQIKRGHHGEASFELPAGISEISNVDIKCPGYKVVSKAPFAIVNGVVEIEMIMDAAPPPLPPDKLPTTEIFPMLPPQSEVEATPAVPANEVTLFYRNLSGEFAELWLCSFYRHYKINADNLHGSPWLKIHLEVSAGFTAYNNFAPETGWFGLVVRDKYGDYHYLTSANLYNHAENYFTLRPRVNGRYDFELNESSQ